MLQFRASDLIGILNGIISSWNPSKDTAIPHHIDSNSHGQSYMQAIFENEFNSAVEKICPYLELSPALSPKVWTY